MSRKLTPSQESVLHRACSARGLRITDAQREVGWGNTLAALRAAGYVELCFSRVFATADGVVALAQHRAAAGETSGAHVRRTKA
jgi:hypothetical protein